MVNGHAGPVESMDKIYRLLRVLREEAGLTQSALAAKMNISRDTVARIETGAQKLTVDYLMQFAVVIKLHPVDILRRMEANEPSFVYLFRAHGSEYFTDAIRRRYENWYNGMEKLNARVNISRLRKIPQKDYRFTDDESASERGVKTARWLREQWNMVRGSITDPVDLIESLGYYITGMDLGENDLFAITGRKGENGRPGIVVNTNDNITIERQHFSIIHELGHIVEHGEEFEEQPVYSGYGRNKDDREKFADAFAGEFLVPSCDLIELYRRMPADYPLEKKIILLKGHFKVSYQVILIRLFSNGLLKMNKQFFWQYYGRMKQKYGKSEPVPLECRLDFRQEREMRELAEVLNDVDDDIYDNQA